MNLIVQPADGVTPLISAIKRATKRIEIVIFRFNIKELQKALEAAVVRGVQVHALIASFNRGGDKRLRKLELDLLAAGLTVSRTDIDLVRYHGKMMVVDRETLYVLGFNFTKLDTQKSRSFAVSTRHPRLVQEAAKLFEADSARQPYTPTVASFVVSPENARASLTKLIKSARKQLLIYDMKFSDKPMLNLLRDRAKAGVEIRLLGKLGKDVEGVKAEKLPKLRLHVRAILRDNQDLFIGSQSMRSLELDKRREVGVIVRGRETIARFREVYEEDWAGTTWAEKDAKDKKKREEEEAAKKDKEKEKEKERVAS
jgi:phosphatidylserine/phosphatidylglycerophosphate/cardiolipin synthase-like enzyme